MKNFLYSILLLFLISSCSDSVIEDENLNDFTKDSGTFIDERDKHQYKWIKIGNQIWMAENLAYLPSVNWPEDFVDYSPRYYVQGFFGSDVVMAKSTANYKTFGVLYNWPAAKNVAPTGWHLPSDKEWQELEVTLGMTPSEAAAERGERGTNQGIQMKSKNGWDENGNGTNSSGFNGFPSGEVNRDGFKKLETYGLWWSTTNHGYGQICRYLSCYTTTIGKSERAENIGASVRCIKD